jgi:hypothetical protein
MAKAVILTAIPVCFGRQMTAHWKFHVCLGLWVTSHFLWMLRYPVSDKCGNRPLLSSPVARITGANVDRIEGTVWGVVPSLESSCCRIGVPVCVACLPANIIVFSRHFAVSFTRSFAKFAECSRMDGVQSLVPEDCQAALFHWLTPHRYDSPSLQHSERDTMLVWEAATLLAQPNSVDDETLKDAAAAVKASVNRLRSLVQFAENLGNRGDVIAEDLVAAVNAMASLVPDAVLPQN